MQTKTSFKAKIEVYFTSVQLHFIINPKFVSSEDVPLASLFETRNTFQ